MSDEPSPAAVWVRGRPLLGTHAGELGAGEPVELRCRGGRIVERRRAGRGPLPGLIGSCETILAPTLTDSHAHLMAAAARRVRFDAGPEAAPELSKLLSLLARMAQASPGEGWLVAAGFDEALIPEQRPPTLREIDATVGQRALRVRHATRHASLFSSAALARIEAAGLGYGLEVVAPGSALFFERQPVLTRLIPGPEGEALMAALRTLAQDWLRGGIAHIDDLTASNDAGRVAFLAQARRRGVLPQSLRAWLGDADEFEGAQRAAQGTLTLAGVKILAHDEATVRAPAFVDAVRRARRRGLPVAIHAAAADVTDAVLDVLEQVPPTSGAGAAPDRIEHAFLCPPALAARLRRAGVWVVVQPGFLEARARKYEHELEPALWPWLQPLRSLGLAGVPLAAGSDAPVGPGGAAVGLRGAITRGPRDGRSVFGPAEVLAPAVALELWARPFASSRRVDGGLGEPRPGDVADMALLERLPSAVNGFEFEAPTVILGGRVLDCGPQPEPAHESPRPFC